MGHSFLGSQQLLMYCRNVLPDYHFCKCLPLASILSYMNPTHNLTPYFVKTHFNIIISFTPTYASGLFPSGFITNAQKELFLTNSVNTRERDISGHKFMHITYSLLGCDALQYGHNPEDSNLYIHSYEKYCKLRFLGGTLQLHKFPAHITAVQKTTSQKHKIKN